MTRKIAFAQVKKLFAHNIIKNISWLFLDKVCRLGVGLIVSVWVAKYLGPHDFGKWNYSIAVVALVSAFSTLGLDQILVKKLIENKDQEEILIGAAFYLRITGAITSILLSLAYITIFSDGESQLFIITLLTSSTLIFQSFDVIDLKLQSILKSKVSVLIKNSAFLICAALKVLVILNQCNLIYFVIISVIEIALGAFGLIIQYGVFKVISWRPNVTFAKQLLKECWPLILSGIIIMLYMRIDQVMIGKMLDEKSVGLYSVSVKFSELWYFIPTVFVSSFFPKLIKLKSDETGYRKLCLKIFRILFFISFGIGLTIALLAHDMILILYGNLFIASAFALKISIWTSIFVFWGVAAANMLVIDGLNKHNLYKSVHGVILNIALNFILIPRFGINGAAIATLISQAYASYFYYLLKKETRYIFFLQTRSILFFLK
ncbi:flippase [Mucilaginibacter sp. FT3.2]|uniref:flippase n=1 Tax=Mucilaginibacter sp. FT3.2 TaxID=2723090 RepID=UPI0016133D7F|nr:flippase [Mucilaginibacter sp. FT3.2]MBB6230811.1 PST family polysaccharide transporter [Mucilaginibacter sp. FT3.2]